MDKRADTQGLIDQLFSHPAQAAAVRKAAPKRAVKHFELDAAAPPGLAEAPAAAAAPPIPTRLFSHFDDADMAEVHDLVGDFQKIWDVDQSPHSIAVRANEEAATRGRAPVQHALSIFSAATDGFDAYIPTLRDQLKSAGGVPATMPRPVTPEPEMDYWRHDIDLSDHHNHWHTIYPASKDPDSPVHGQLFVYMHQQMLARYDTDRRAAGLPEVDRYAAEFARIRPSGAFGAEHARTAVDRHRLSQRGRHAAVLRRAPNRTCPERSRRSSSRSRRKRKARCSSRTRASSAWIRVSYPSAEALGRDIEGARYYATDPGPNNMHNRGHMLLRTTGHEDSSQTGVMASTATAMT